MTLPEIGKISFSDLRNEYSDAGATSLSEFYRGRAKVLDNYGANNTIPGSGRISLSDFRGKYLEGTTLQKLENWRQHRHNGFIWAGSEGTDGRLVTQDNLNIGANPVGAYQPSDEIINAGANRLNLSANSKWTSIFGVAGMAGGSSRANPIVTSFAEDEVYNNSTAGNANCVVDQVNLVNREIGDISFVFNRSAGRSWANGILFTISGKWSFDRQTTASSVVLQSGEIICWAKERGGDGFSQGYYFNNSPECTYNVVNGWWYNTGFVGVSTNGSNSPQTFNIVGETSPDMAWIFTQTA
jgi:hypothetical protein